MAIHCYLRRRCTLCVVRISSPVRMVDFSAPLDVALCRPCRRHCCYLWLVLIPILGPAPCVHCVRPRSGNHRAPSGWIGSLNFFSAVRKAAQIHSLIADHKLDVLVIQKSNIRHDHPAGVRNDVAPAGYSVPHAHRDPSAQNYRGDGLAVIHRHTLTVKSLSVDVLPSTTKFKHQVISIRFGSRNILLANIC